MHVVEHARPATTCAESPQPSHAAAATASGVVRSMPPQTHRRGLAQHPQTPRQPCALDTTKTVHPLCDGNGCTEHRPLARHHCPGHGRPARQCSVTRTTTTVLTSLLNSRHSYTKHLDPRERDIQSQQWPRPLARTHIDHLCCAGRMQLTHRAQLGARTIYSCQLHTTSASTFVRRNWSVPVRATHLRSNARCRQATSTGAGHWLGCV